MTGKKVQRYFGVLILVFLQSNFIAAQVREEWVAIYNGPGNRTDQAKAIAVDTKGNVYVTGRSMRAGTFEDYATIKHDSEGNQVWVARYSGPGNRGSTANAIALDAEGNTCVTGSS